MHSEDDIPSADPQIRLEYEAALGRFVLAHNEVDYYLGQIIGLSLDRLSETNTDIAQTFAGRLAQLAILRHSNACPELSKPNLARLAQLNASRNRLAHGHFDQNPFDGTYKLVEKARERDFPIAVIAAEAAELAGIAETLRDIKFWFMLADLDDLD